MEALAGLSAAQLATQGVRHLLIQREMRSEQANGRLFQVLVEKDAKPSPVTMVDFWEKVSSLFAPWHNHYISFEIHATEEGIGFYVWTPKHLEDFMQRNLNAVHPAAEVTEVKHDYLQTERFANRSVKAATLSLESHYLFNLFQASGDRFASDPVTSLCSTLANFKDGEEVILQFIVRPVHIRYRAMLERPYDLLSKYQVRPSFYPTLALYQPVFNRAAIIGREISLSMSTNLANNGKPPPSQDVKSIKAKLESSCLFDVAIRVLSVALKPAAAHNNLITVTSAFTVLTDTNRFKVTRHAKSQPFIKALCRRDCPSFVGNNLLSPAEMASFLHYPEGAVPYVRRLKSKKMPVPEGISIYDTYPEAKADGAIVFGYSVFRGKFKYVAFKDLRMLMQHAYIIGATGAGKTTLLQMLVLEVMPQCGVTFFDVKGDAVKQLMQFIPPSAMDRVVYVDFSSDDYYLPFNILKIPGLSLYDLATLLVQVFITVFGESSIQFHSQNVLRQALLAVLATDAQGSILEVYRMFTDEAYLDTATGKLEALGDMPDVLSYWKKYKAMKVAAREKEHGAILNKLQLITQNTRPRYTLCQKDNVLKFRKLIDSKAIVLVNLDMGKNDAMIQRFFGTLLTAFIRKAFYSRSDIPEKDRVPHLFILDEFEKFTKQDEDFKDLLALVRSYGGGLVLTHQSVKQLDESMLALIADNTFTQISLNVGDGSAQKVARMFPGFQDDDLTGLVPFQAVGRLKKLNPQPFTFQTIKFDELYQDFGAEHAENIIKRTHKRVYKTLSAIKDDINDRYRTTEENLISEDAVPVARKNNASGKLERKGRKNDQSAD